MRTIYFIAVLLAACVMLNANLSPIMAAEYFFDSQMGSDENQGISPEIPFKTLGKLRYLNLGPGDVVRFKRGCEFRDRLSFQGNGIENNPIRLTAYGDGSKPEILGSINLTEWENHGGEVYRQVVPLEEFYGKKTVYSAYEYDEGEVPTRLLSDSAVPTDRGRFFFEQATSTIYLITSDGLDPSQHRIEVSVIEQLVDLTNRSWIEIDEIAFLFGNCRHIVIRNSHDITIRNCASLFVGFYGNPNVLILDDSERVKLVDCFLYENYNNGVFISTGSSQCVVSGCIIVKCRYNDGVTIHQGGNGEYAGDYNIVENNVIGLCHEESIDITSGDYHIIRGNICYGNGNPGIIVGHDSDHNLIQNNICFDNQRAGIYISGDEEGGSRGYNQVIQNLIYNNEYPAVEVMMNNTMVYNNTMINSLDRVAVRITSNGNDSELRNNIIAALDPEIPLQLLQFISSIPTDLNVKLSHNLFFHLGDQINPGEFFPAGHIIKTGENHRGFTVEDFLEEYGTGEFSFVAEPEFTNSSDSYYFLTPKSPGVNAGTDVGLPFKGPSPDLGWKERKSEASAPKYPPMMIDGEDDDDAILYFWGKQKSRGELVIKASVDITPDVLNVKSKGNWISCNIKLPDGYSVHNIDVDSILLEDKITIVDFSLNSDHIICKFDRQAVINYLDGFVGDVALEVTADMEDNLTNYESISFKGTDTIEIIDPGKSKKAPAQSLVFEAPEPYPKPANPEVWIPYKLAKDVEVAIAIYNSSGHLIRNLNLGYRSAGIYISKDKAAHWDGRNEAGEQVSSGIYFYTIQAGSDFTATKKMMMAK